MTSDLSFEGYSSREAAPNDPMSAKWNAVRSALDVPASVELPELTLAGIGSFNDRLGHTIAYTAEPSGMDAWQPPAQTLARLLKLLGIRRVAREITSLSDLLHEDQPHLEQRESDHDAA